MTRPRPAGESRIDAHQHFWRLTRGDYGWLTPDQAAIYRDFQPADLAPLMARTSMTRAVLVQAAPTVAETRFLLATAAATDFVAGVVCWAPLDAPGAADVLADLSRNPALKGVRPMLHDLPDVDRVLRPALAPALRAVADLGLAFDVLVRPAHLPALRALLDRHPSLRLVIDHAAKPEIAAGRVEPWATDMRALARNTGALVKLSGLVTEAEPDWSVEHLRPYVDLLLAEFGPERMMFGSDWPVVTMRASYEAWMATTEALLGRLDAAARAAIFGGTAARFYRL